ncbi:ATP-binding protein [Rhodococcus erythropolis]|uniref:ATP-binding protein n=1 Tax=Rhodococcus erythropolis TaxID=1833 RepID=UPI001BEAC27C|nr:ATP-binding protein [Rhodococcus erythropolis]MBT2264365.1 ATP-binding protein [Rhodococcus erythropolis]
MSDDAGIRVMEEVASAKTLDSIHALLAQVFTEHAIDGLVAMQFELAVAEIGANIIEHSNKGASVTLRLEIEAVEDRIEARYIDDGQPARVELDAVSLPDDFAERGRGLAIALNVLDELGYRRSNGKNHWQLVRNLTSV